MRVFYCCVLFFSSLWGSGISILSPDDPKYAWMDALIEKEFAAYEQSGITQEMLIRTAGAELHDPTPGSKLVHFRIVNSQIYGPKEGDSQRVASDWNLHMNGGAVWAMLRFLVEHYDVPDVEFLYLQHGGLVTPTEGAPGPFLTSAKHQSSKHQILFHEWYFYMDVHSAPTGANNWTEALTHVESSVDKIAWEKKIAQVFWRGHSNGFPADDVEWMKRHWREIPRIEVSYLSWLYPEVVNAGVVDSRSFCLWKLQTEGINLRKPGAAFEEHMGYKYQLCLDGETCTYPGYQWRLLSNCCTLKQDSPQIQWFYPRLDPWVHYVPVKNDLSDLLEKIEWLQTHDDEAKKIAENARAFAHENLMPEQIALYCYKTLVKYASLQRFQVEAPKRKRRRR